MNYYFKEGWRELLIDVDVDSEVITTNLFIYLSIFTKFKLYFFCSSIVLFLEAEFGLNHAPLSAFMFPSYVFFLGYKKIRVVPYCPSFSIHSFTFIVQLIYSVISSQTTKYMWPFWLLSRRVNWGTSSPRKRRRPAFWSVNSWRRRRSRSARRPVSSSTKYQVLRAFVLKVEKNHSGRNEFWQFQNKLFTI